MLAQPLIHQVDDRGLKGARDAGCEGEDIRQALVAIDAEDSHPSPKVLVLLSQTLVALAKKAASSSSVVVWMRLKACVARERILVDQIPHAASAWK